MWRRGPALESQEKQEGGDGQHESGASITARPASRTFFRFRLRAALRPRVRAGRSETLAWKRERALAVNLGSVEDLEREIVRSRRFGHSFVLARVPRSRAAAEANGWQDPTMVLLASQIRAVDRIWSDGEGIYLLLPESDRPSGNAALVRLREPLSELLSEDELDGIRAVVFAPDECPTSCALLSALGGGGWRRKETATSSSRSRASQRVRNESLRVQRNRRA
jgi:hypothetical protein